MGSRDEAFGRKPVIRSPERHKKETKNGSLHWSGLQALPPRGHEALPQGGALLHREVLVHAPAVPAGAARPGAHQAERVRGPPAREAEGAAHLRRPRAPVPRSTTSTRRRRKGRTGEQMLGLLERRLDNVVHRLGFAFTRVAGAPAREARPRARQRQARRHPERTSCAPGDKIEIREKSREIKEIVASLAQVEKRPQLSWLELDKANFAGTFKGAPVREEMNEPAIREQLRRRVLLALSRAVTLERARRASSRLAEAHGQATEAAGERVRRRVGIAA